MGRFSEDMGRLRDEIVAERQSRQSLIADTREEVTAAAHAFITDLKSTVETLQTGFRDAHADMAETSRADRNAFLARLGDAVSDIRTEAADRQSAVREALIETAAQDRSQRSQSMHQMRGAVTQMVGGFASERESARMAWLGAAPKPAVAPIAARPKVQDKSQPKAQAESAEPAPRDRPSRRYQGEEFTPH